MQLNILALLSELNDWDQSHWYSMEEIRSSIGVHRPSVHRSIQKLIRDDLVIEANAMARSYKVNCLNKSIKLYALKEYVDD